MLVAATLVRFTLKKRTNMRGKNNNPCTTALLSNLSEQVLSQWENVTREIINDFLLLFSNFYS